MGVVASTLDPLFGSHARASVRIAARALQHITTLIMLALHQLCITALPTVRLTNGVLSPVDMPVLAAGTAGFKGEEATSAVTRAFAAGLMHVHTAYDYFNLPAVAEALKTAPSRESIFVSSMTSPCIHPAAPPKRNVTDPEECYELTMTEVKSVLGNLSLAHLDLIMLHGPSEPFGHIGGCGDLVCKLNAAQWRAYIDLRKAGLVKAIGVSNFCQSCLACLNAAGAPPDQVPAVNQIQVHVGQGSSDPGGGLLSYCSKRGIVVQAYEPLAGGELVKDADCAKIGLAHNKSAAQVALRWVLQRAPTLAVKAGTAEHLQQDLAVLSFALTEAELALLDKKTTPKGEAGGRCSWGCTE